MILHMFLGKRAICIKPAFVDFGVRCISLATVFEATSATPSLPIVQCKSFTTNSFEKTQGNQQTSNQIPRYQSYKRPTTQGAGSCPAGLEFLAPELLCVARSPLIQCFTIQGCFCTSSSDIRFSGSNTSSWEFISISPIQRSLVGCLLS